MKKIRVVARIDVKGLSVVNTIQLEGQRKCGDPSSVAKTYYDDGVDELLIIDQVASLQRRGHLAELTKSFAKNIFVPVTVGGGIRSVEDARTLLRNGAEKIAVNTAAIESPDLIESLVNEFGRQCVVVSIQARKVEKGRWLAFKDGGREPTGIDAVQWASNAVSRGAGEILITSIDRDGTRRGFDIELVDAICQRVSCPVIASGGLGIPAHAVELLSKTDCDSFASADFLHMKRGGGLGELKSLLAVHGFSVRVAPKLKAPLTL